MSNPTAAMPCRAAGTQAPSAAIRAAPGASALLPWLQSRRLRLREFDMGDVDDLVQMHSDPRLRAQLVDDYPLHQEQVVNFFVERLGTIYRDHEGLGIWHASCPGTGAFAGWFSLMPMAERTGQVEIGARLKPAFWGTGLATEGIECLLNHAFDDLGLSEVIGICHPDNRSARAVLTAMGFTADGVSNYDYTMALYHHVSLNAWRVARNTPIRTRLRRALQACRR